MNVCVRFQIGHANKSLFQEKNVGAHVLLKSHTSETQHGGLFLFTRKENFTKKRQTVVITYSLYPKGDETSAM